MTSPLWQRWADMAVAMIPMLLILLAFKLLERFCDEEIRRGGVFGK